MDSSAADLDTSIHAADGKVSMMHPGLMLVLLASSNKKQLQKQTDKQTNPTITPKFYGSSTKVSS